MKLDVALAAPALVVMLAATGIVAIRAATATAPTAVSRATPEDKRVVALIAAQDEPAWSNQAVQAFPEDHWSARDDFHSREIKRLKEVAKERKLPIEDVLRAVDDDLHRMRARGDSPDFRAARAVPCKPRPFYD